jgi:hypothetical protein
MRLSLPVLSQESQCPRCARGILDVFGVHALACAGRGAASKRHDSVRDTLYSCAQKAGIISRCEVPGLLLGHGVGDERRPADILVHNFLDGRDACVDLVGVDALEHSQPSMADNDADWIPSRPILKAVKLKNDRNKLDVKNIGKLFVPFVFSSLGGLSDGAVNFVKFIGDAWSVRTGRSKSSCVKEVGSLVGAAILRTQTASILERVHKVDNVVSFV